MLSLYLIASHMAGDYIFQSAAMSANKLKSVWWRAFHVIVYTICFIPVTVIYANNGADVLMFLGILGISHFITDSKRWRTSNPWVAMPILQDQSLHIIQIAILSILFFS